MAILFTPVGIKNPTNSDASMLYYPRAVQSDAIDMDGLSEIISLSTTLTEADCQAVIYALVHTISNELQQGKIVRLGHLGSFQISIKGTASAAPEKVNSENISSASIIYRPGKRFKDMLRKLEYKRTK